MQCEGYMAEYRCITKLKKLSVWISYTHIILGILIKEYLLSRFFITGSSSHQILEFDFFFLKQTSKFHLLLIPGMKI
jgi:hypothetical protein